MVADHGVARDHDARHDEDVAADPGQPGDRRGRVDDAGEALGHAQALDDPPPLAVGGRAAWHGEDLGPRVLMSASRPTTG